LNSESTLTVEDDDPTVATAGLGVVAEANVVTLHARRLAVISLVHLVATETGIPGLHAGQLRENKQKKEGICKLSHQQLKNKLWVTRPIMHFIINPFGAVEENQSNDRETHFVGDKERNIKDVIALPVKTKHDYITNFA